MHTMRLPAIPPARQPNRRRVLAGALTLPWLGLSGTHAQEKTTEKTPEKTPNAPIKIYQSTA
ncbi:MAG: hypothetical protein K2X65_00990, partial [Burkholderiaceae bacterium]|nr:hypothetical protein [Burkholderiaceae bacterium]